jgi:hypothetical protein
VNLREPTGPANVMAARPGSARPLRFASAYSASSRARRRCYRRALVRSTMHEL